MKIAAVLFDLDGTLLPMDQELFTKGYFSLLIRRLSPMGFTQEEVVAAIWDGTGAMVKNNGEKSNEDVFWQRLTEKFGDKWLRHKAEIDDFYRTDFAGAEKCCGKNPKAAETVALVKEKGLRTALATNPIFPGEGTAARIRWAGIDPGSFELITVYENIGYAKPNPAYYTEVVRRMGLQPGECLMVGNDVGEDMIPAAAAGLPVFLLTDCLINKTGADIEAYPHGGFDALMEHLKRLNV